MRGRATRRSVNLDDLLRWPAILTQTVYTPGEVERFLAKVDIRGDGECWPWTGAVNDRGYGQCWISGRMERAHRASYALSVGPIPDGLCVCHHCDVPSCCNPSHLFLGTIADNNADMVAKKRNRAATGDSNGSRTRPDRLARGERHSSRTHPERVARGDRHGSRIHPERCPRGERSGAAKLTESNVLEIRAAVARGEPHRSIAAQFGVSRSNIGYVARGHTWAHVTGDAVSAVTV